MLVRDSIFLTGITGAIGSWLAREALHRGFHVTALVRDKDLEAARRRIEAALDIVGARTSGRDIEIALGDIALKGLGMRAAGVPSHFRTIVHCAGCIEFHDQAAKLSRRTNVEGTRHVLEFASRHRVPVVHVSTAYICGLRAGTVKEDEVDLGQGFHNVYERTKCEAEKRVHQWSRETSLPAIVLRPSIVVGDSREGRTVRFNTLYDLMHAFERIAPSLGGEEIRVAGSARATKNLIPIDYFGGAAWRIISRGVPGTYHITNPAPVTVGEMRNVFARLFGVGRIRLVGADEFARRAATRAERLYQRATEIYAPYMTGEPRFDRANTDAALSGSGIEMPAMDLPFFERLLGYARRADWGRRHEEPLPIADFGLPIEGSIRSHSAFGNRQSAISVGPPPDVARYFDEFLVSKLHQQLLPQLRRLTASFRVVMKESPREHWSVAIVRGALESVTRNGMPTQCTFLVDYPTFTEIVGGRLSPKQAFFKRRIEISGDMEAGLKLATVLAEFFRQFPFEAGG